MSLAEEKIVTSRWKDFSGQKKIQVWRKKVGSSLFFWHNCVGALAVAGDTTRLCSSHCSPRRGEQKTAQYTKTILKYTKTNDSMQYTRNNFQCNILEPMIQCNTVQPMIQCYTVWYNVIQSNTVQPTIQCYTHATQFNQWYNVI